MNKPSAGGELESWTILKDGVIKSCRAHMIVNEIQPRHRGAIPQQLHMHKLSQLCLLEERSHIRESDQISLLYKAVILPLYNLDSKDFEDCWCKKMIIH